MTNKHKGMGFLAGALVFAGLATAMAPRSVASTPPRVVISPGQSAEAPAQEWRPFKCELRGRSLYFFPQAKDVRFVERTNGRGVWRVTTPETNNREITVADGAICGYIRS